MRLLLVLSSVIALGASACTRRVTEEDLFHPRQMVLQEAPENARAVDIQRGAGIALSGWLLTVDPAAPTLVYFCGNAETVADSMPRLRWMSATLRVNAMAFDYRGYGASGGAPGLKICGEDAVAVIAGLRAMRGYVKAPVIVYGRSIGGGMAVYAAAHTDVDGLILEAPPASCPAVIEAWNPNLPWYIRWCVTLRPAPELAEPSLQPITMIPQVRCPLLIMHGAHDTVIPFAQGQDLCERAGSPKKRFLALPESGHNDLRIDHDPVCQALKLFVAEVVQPGG